MPSVGAVVDQRLPFGPFLIVDAVGIVRTDFVQRAQVQHHQQQQHQRQRDHVQREEAVERRVGRAGSRP